jgi:hypothetical protein
VYPGQVIARALVCLLGLACAAPRAPAAPAAPSGAETAAPAPEDLARSALSRFAAAASAARWQDAWAILSASWRARLTPEGLAADWRASGPIGPRALSRLEAALASGERVQVRPGGGSALLPIGGGRAALLVLEEGGWRVDALE